jgi:hypothetical protein
MYFLDSLCNLRDREHLFSLKKVLIGLILTFLIGSQAFSAHAVQNETVSIQKNNPEEVFSNQTKIMRSNIRMILKDRRFDYPDHFRSIKKLWRRIAGWFVNVKSVRKTLDHQLWSQIFRALGLASLLFLPFLLIYYLPKIFIRSGMIKTYTGTDHHKNIAKSADDLKNQAKILAEKGQIREAIRLLYLTGLEILQKNRILPDSSLRLSDKTNLQIIKHVYGPNHPAYHAFFELVSIFQEKWFGLRGCRIEDYYCLVEELKIIETTMGNSHVET